MLDIRLFRENPEVIRESERRRFKDPNLVDQVLKADQQWRKASQEMDKLCQKRNQASKDIAILKKKGDEKSADAIALDVKKLNIEIVNLREKVKKLLNKRDELRYRIGNIIHESVPLGEDESKNEVVRKWGNPPKFNFTPKPHADLVVELGGADIEKASEVVCARSYYLLNDLVLLNLALIQFAMDRLRGKGYKPVWTPFFLREGVMRAASELGDFQDQLYKIPGEKGEAFYLIATSEQTLAALHMNELIDEAALPIKYVGFSTCFRREAGSHGKDTKGIFRVHQFDKVEQYVYCHPDDSWNIHEEIIRNAEELYQELGLHYRIVNIASGEMNDNAAKKYDLEVWFPAQQTYREIVSASNCTDYQARKLNIRVGKHGGKEKQVLHTLNSTALATERTICAILENYQTKDGRVVIPESLRPFIGIDEIKPSK